jgi:adenosylhomocysteine nucleosidase
MQKPLCIVVQALESEFVPFDSSYFTVKHVFTGFGKVSAAVGLTSAIVKYSPQCVINIGTAGSSKHTVESIVVCNRFVDRDIAALKALNGCYQSESPLYDSYFGSLFDMVEPGVCNTGDRFVTTPVGDDDVYDMEAFALSRVCNLFEIPFVAIKYVTDRIGENSVKIWEEKLADSREHLTDFMNNIVASRIEEGFLSGARLGQM